MSRAAWLNLPHARTVADRVERELERLRALDGPGSAEMNTLVLELKKSLDPWAEDPPPDIAEAEADAVAVRARALVTAITSRDAARSDRLGQCVRNLFECLGLESEGRDLALDCGEDPDSPMR